MADASRNLLLTGIPRSGTTLLTALVDSMPQAVALNEPKWQYNWANRNQSTSKARDFSRWLVGDFADIRRKLLTGTPIPERRSPEGEAVTNYYRMNSDEPRLGKNFDLVPFTRPGLEKDFLLAVKHNGLYLGALPQLVDIGAFRIIAIIRNPVGVIASWNNVPIPLKTGQMPGAMLYWRQMAEVTSAKMNMLEKQVRMYDLVCKRLHALRQHIHILRYEDLTDNPGLLVPLTERSPALSPDVIKKRDNRFYAADTDAIRNMLKRVGHHYREFYEVK